MTAGKAETAEGRCALYRVFGPDDALLYVGISNNFGTRWQQHAGKQEWWPEVRRQTVDWYDTRIEAAAAEVDAIKTERPQYNRAHNQSQVLLTARPVVFLPTPRLSPQTRLRDQRSADLARFGNPWRDCTIHDEDGFMCGQPLVDGACPDHGVIDYEMVVTDWSRADAPIEDLRAAGETIRWSSVS